MPPLASAAECGVHPPHPLAMPLTDEVQQYIKALLARERSFTTDVLKLRLAKLLAQDATTSH